MSKYRKDRVNDAVAQELSVALRELSDPRIAERLVSITHAEVSPDLKIAKVYFSTIEEPKETGKLLDKASGLLRHLLAERLNLRITPELVFVYDDSLKHGARIAELLDSIRPKDSPQESDQNGENG